MTRNQALEIATKKYDAFQAARIANLFHGAAEPKEADYNYKHGWIVDVGGFNFSSAEISGPVNQPYMD